MTNIFYDRENLYVEVNKGVYKSKNGRYLYITSFKYYYFQNTAYFSIHMTFIFTDDLLF